MIDPTGNRYRNLYTDAGTGGDPDPRDLPEDHNERIDAIVAKVIEDAEDEEHRYGAILSNRVRRRYWAEVGR